MRLGDWLRRLHRGAFAGRIRSDRPIDPIAGPSAVDRKQVLNEVKSRSPWLEAFEAGRLTPPGDCHDRAAWDQFWSNCIDVGHHEHAFADQVASNPALPGLLNRRGARTVLCAGNGLSIEATSLALYGFDVTALDISAVPAESFGRGFRHPEHPVHAMPGFELHDDGSVTFAASSPIDPELCPEMHRSTDHPPRGGGALSFITGDLTDPEVCPGPFDVIIERRTLQLFDDVERPAALECLAARFGERATLLSHQHSGGWRPGDAQTHFAEAWCTSRGFTLIRDAESDLSESAPRLAFLMFTSG